MRIELVYSNFFILLKLLVRVWLLFLFLFNFIFVHVCVCVWVCACTCFLHVCICVSVQKNVCVRVCVYMCVCVCMHVRARTCTLVHTCASVCMCGCYWFSDMFNFLMRDWLNLKPLFRGMRYVMVMIACCSISSQVIHMSKWAPAQRPKSIPLFIFYYFVKP